LLDPPTHKKPAAHVGKHHTIWTSSKPELEPEPEPESSSPEPSSSTVVVLVEVELDVLIPSTLISLDTTSSTSIAWMLPAEQRYGVPRESPYAELQYLPGGHSKQSLADSKLDENLLNAEPP
jgi:hypothetical protein